MARLEELKNDLAVTGVLHSVDQYLNVKLASVRVANPEKHPQVGMKAGRKGRREPFFSSFSDADPLLFSLDGRRPQLLRARLRRALHRAAGGRGGRRAAARRDAARGARAVKEESGRARHAPAATAPCNPPPH